MNLAENPLLVLLVEDSEDDAFFFNLALRKTGVNCQVIHLADGRKAIEYFEGLHSGAVTRHPDLVFLDLKLPLLSGFDILEWIGTRSYDPPLRVAILSGSDHEADKARARTLGAADYLVKPVSAEQLLDRLSHLLYPTPLEAHPQNSSQSSDSAGLGF